MKMYIVTLTDEERTELRQVVNKGSTKAYRIRHASILLNADEHGPNMIDKEIAKAHHCHTNTVANVRERFVEQGLEAALERKKREKLSREAIVDGETEARLLSIACGKPPEGRSRWTVRLLASRMVELEYVPQISRTTVHNALKKMNLSLTYANAG